MKKYFISLIVGFVFIVSTVSFVFGAGSTFPFDNSVWFREGVRQMGQNSQKAVQAFYDGCYHNDIPSCSMIAIAEWPISHKKSIAIAKRWLQILQESKSQYVQGYRERVLESYIQFYSAEGQDVTWLKKLQ